MIATFTGKLVNPLDLSIRDVCIEDIAHALSNICRYTGHTGPFYSVAEHCVRVSALCSQSNKLAALLHDASEAYLGDVSAPLKHLDMFREYRRFEERAQEAIWKVLVGGLWKMPPQVEYYDKLIRCIESYSLMRRSRDRVDEWPYNYIFPWTPAIAKQEFLSRFYLLTSK